MSTFWTEVPATTIHKATGPAGAKDAVKEIAGTAEFLRAIPKKFARLQSIDAERRSVKLLIDGEGAPTTWTLTPDAEVKVQGWWGRLEQAPADARVWCWFKLDRQKKPTAIFMLADDARLSAFVDNVARRNGGRVLQAAPERLGEYVIRDFLRTRGSGRRYILSIG